MTPGILYISYDGMLEPLGQSQVLAYLEKLAPGRRIHLISFEKAGDWRDESKRNKVRQRVVAAGITWHPLRYHKSPSAPATAYDVARGTTVALSLAIRHRLSIVHARSYVPALMALAVKRATSARFLFDMRGLWADERVDGGLWPAGGRLYRTAKALERRFLLAADHVVALTNASAAEIRRFSYLANRALGMSVIPTCADLDKFKIQGAMPRSPFTLGYVGSVGTWYLLDEMLSSFRFVAAELPDARLLIVNRNEHGLIRERIAAAGINFASVELVAADHFDIPTQIARMTAAMAIIKPSYSKIASAPTKLAEYLGCGVPCLGNVGVGDMKEILEGERVGVALCGLADDELKEGARSLIALSREPDISHRCRSTALKLFSLETGVGAYQSIYDALGIRQ
ncbi:MAG: glycosyltransferase [Sphingomonas sp.]|uniref:glycosyltransferase n=1 Tax=Sphingomonas sp. TaxID=28214 RepID=UPI0017A663E9|nr:glycosyltransferase [Sphingomonas sp.]MBA3666266.1 glycosyltransferase [Sphingomonas sp.]